LNPGKGGYQFSAPCQSPAGITGDLTGAKLATFMKSTSIVREISPTEAMAVGVSANRELVNLLAIATDIVLCVDRPQGHLQPGVGNALYTGRFSLKSANCGGDDCVKIMVVNDARFMEDNEDVDSGYFCLVAQVNFCLVAQVNDSGPAIFLLKATIVWGILVMVPLWARLSV
jgi:hypothetical protein